MDRRDITGCVVWLSISISVLIASLRLGIGPFNNPGPGFIPFWAALFLASFTCVLLVISLSRNREATPPSVLWKGRHWVKPLLAFSALILYCLVLPKLGYLLATFVLMLVLLSLGKTKPWLVVPGSLVVVLLTYVLFDYLLKMPLPRGVFGF